MIVFTVYDWANVALLYNLQNPRVCDQSSGLNFSLQNNNNFIYVLQPHIFRAEFVSTKQHLSFNVCCFCQGSLLGLCTASPSLEPHFYMFYSPMDSPNVPHLRSGHISLEGVESHTNLCCSLYLLLVFWFVGWLVGWLLDALVVWITATYSSSSTLKMEAGGYSETWVTVYHWTRRTSQKSRVHQQRCGNLS
jgi:hypothetical protein